MRLEGVWSSTTGFSWTILTRADIGRPSVPPAGGAIDTRGGWTALGRDGAAPRDARHGAGLEARRCFTSGENGAMFVMALSGALPGASGSVWTQGWVQLGLCKIKAQLFSEEIGGLFSEKSRDIDLKKMLKPLTIVVFLPVHKKNRWPINCHFKKKRICLFFVFFCGEWPRMTPFPERKKYGLNPIWLTAWDSLGAWWGAFSAAFVGTGPWGTIEQNSKNNLIS